MHSGIKIYDHSTKFESNLGSDKRGHAAAQPDVRSARVKAFKKRGRKSLLPLPSFRLACFYCISSHLHPETYCTKRQREGEGADRRRGRREGGQGEGRASTTTATSDDIRRKQPSALSLDLFLPPSLSKTDSSYNNHFEEHRSLKATKFCWRLLVKMCRYLKVT